MTINISEAKGPSETGILQSKMCQFFILSTHLSTWTLKQATFLFVAVSSFEVYRTFRTHGRFVPRRFVPKVEMIRTQR